jgi:ABC-type lipoprotein release transport system permease subunit
MVRSWLGMNRPLFAALRLEKIVMFLILALITLVAAFTILSNLLLVTAQRTREIGILRAMGATQGAIQTDLPVKRIFNGADRHRGWRGFRGGYFIAFKTL